MNASGFLPVVTVSVSNLSNGDLRNLDSFVTSILGKDIIVRTTINEVTRKEQYVLIELVGGTYNDHGSELFVLLATLGNEVLRFYPNCIIQCYSRRSKEIVFWNANMVRPIDELLQIFQKVQELMPEKEKLAKKPAQGGRCDCYVSEYHDEPGHTCQAHRFLLEARELISDINAVQKSRNSGGASQALADDFSRRYNERNSFLSIKKAIGV